MTEPAAPFRVGIVPGVTVTKWTRAWSERRPHEHLEVVPLSEEEQRAALDERRVDVCFVRLPVDREGLDVIRLYAETPVVVVSKEHPIALFDSVRTADLDGEVRRAEAPDDALEIVAAGAGVFLAPHSVARLHSRKDVIAVPLEDAPETEIAIAWQREATSDAIEYFVGIVRGRGAASSRGAASAPAPARTTAPRAARPTRATTRARARGGKRRAR